MTLLIIGDACGGRHALEQFVTASHGFGIDLVERLQSFAAATPATVANCRSEYGARHLVCWVAVLGPDEFLEHTDRLHAVADALR